MARTLPTSASQRSAQAGQRMLFFLSEAAITARGDTKREVVAAHADVGWRTILRFEQGNTWPDKLDQMLEAYAIVGGLEDVRQLWQHALDLWYAHGKAPLISRREDGATGAAQRRFADQIRAARQAQREAPPEPAETTNATQKKRAADQ